MAKSQVAVDAPHGPKIYQFLTREWHALGTTRGAWCRENGLADSTLMRWSEGAEPDMRNLRSVAKGLNRPLAEILVASGYLTADDLGLGAVEPRERVGIVESIRLAPDISEAERTALNAVHEAFQLAKETGRTVKVSGGAGKPPTASMGRRRRA